MLKIKHIEFIKVLYDDSLSHNIFSIANIQFSNYPPINGALLYWKRNTSHSNFTKEGDYKFYYDLANVNYYASVKFPKDVNLTRDQKQELAFILLDQRGSIGTYSIKTDSSRKKKFNPKKALAKLHLPDDFDVTCIPSYVGPILDDLDFDVLTKENPHYSKKFIQDYCFWRYSLVKLHPNEFEPYLKYVDFSYICYACDQLSESYLIDRIEEVDITTLQYNYPVLGRLSASFKNYMIQQLETTNEPINPHFKDEIDLFIEDDTYFDEYSTIDLADFEFEEETEEKVELQFFEFDRGQYKWPGSEHLIKGIPSFACQIYDEYGYKKPSTKEMDCKMKNYHQQQITLVSAILEPHWLHRYREIINWHAVCLYNRYLTEDFLNEHLQYVDFEALGQNLWCELSEGFIEKHIHQFNHNQPVPIIIRHLTEQMYLTYRDTIKIDSDLLFQYYDSIGDEEYEKIQSLLED